MAAQAAWWRLSGVLDALLVFIRTVVRCEGKVLSGVVWSDLLKVVMLVVMRISVSTSIVIVGFWTARIHPVYTSNIIGFIWFNMFLQNMIWLYIDYCWLRLRTVVYQSSLLITKWRWCSSSPSSSWMLFLLSIPIIFVRARSCSPQDQTRWVVFEKKELSWIHWLWVSQLLTKPCASRDRTNKFSFYGWYCHVRRKCCCDQLQGEGEIAGGPLARSAWGRGWRWFRLRWENTGSIDDRICISLPGCKTI